MMYLCIFMLGASIASFVNVVSLRKPLEIDYIKGRSYCPKCHHVLDFFDMIPILGWLCLKGKCRYCGHHISLRYLLIEAIGGMVILICFQKYGWQSMFFLSSALFMILILIALIDYQTMIIPDEFIIMIFVLDLILFLNIRVCLVDHVLGFLIISVPMFLVNNCYQESFGGGDIKLFAVCGLFVGWKKILLAAFLSVIFASCLTLPFMFMKKVKKSDFIPFGPFIAIGMIITVLYGNEIMYFYMNYFL